MAFLSVSPISDRKQLCGTEGGVSVLHRRLGRFRSTFTGRRVSGCGVCCLVRSTRRLEKQGGVIGVGIARLRMVAANVVNALFGGMLLALSTSLHLALSGRLTGLSGIFRGLLYPSDKSFSWKAAYISGLLASFLGMYTLNPAWLTSLQLQGIVPTLMASVLGGFLVGVGTTIGNGCTSGHGLCGIPRLSIRSIVATGTFMMFGIATSTLVQSNPLFRATTTSLDTPFVNLRALVGGISVLLLWASVRTSSKHGPPNWIAFVCAALFGAGLSVGGMVRADIVLGFLTWGSFATWNPSLLILFVTAVAINLLTFAVIFRRLPRPLFPRVQTEDVVKSGESTSVPAGTFDLPQLKNVTPRLIVGSILFGIGWGLTGSCPGPALGQFSTGTPRAFIVLGAILVGDIAGKAYQQQNIDKFRPKQEGVGRTI